MFRSPTRRRTAASLAAALLAFTAACGGTDGDTDADLGVASLDDGAAPAAASDVDPSGDQPGNDEAQQAGTQESDVDAPENPEDALALFDECMGDAGFTSLSETADDDGLLEVIGDGEAAAAGPQEDLDPDEFEEILSGCEAHLANIDGGFDISPEQQAQFEDAQLEWTECMREQGVEVPEMDSSGSGMIVIGGPGDDADPQVASVDELDFEQFQEADMICSEVFEQFQEPGE